VWWSELELGASSWEDLGQECCDVRGIVGGDLGDARDSMRDGGGAIEGERERRWWGFYTVVSIALAGSFSGSSSSRASMCM
jgi:hypothetical protein